MRRLLWLCGLLALPVLAQAGAAAQDHGAKEHSVIVYGKPDGKVAGWGIATDLPSGWTQDCCQYAQAIGVNLVLYRGEWTGEPERVMVLNVWPQKLPSLDAEWQDDQKRYLQRDPTAKVSTFAVHNPAMACHGLLFQGTDHKDDVVVFCDPGKATGVRLSWSMTMSAADPTRQSVLALFSQVVEQSSYMKYVSKQASPDKAKH
ncbi:hypothetical protein [Dyella tabacisoli]|uniref:Uncharacterized protein n=1 Tax=Dyella tabacisoli TaxID=2282381 RepID=A0A369UPB3_9GAMM|nr:hypothetical protein [Dyella tabacisoli]RDD81885.1 hypothetical protein DVJ77_08800 [Dyella tabacisoli]